MALASSKCVDGMLVLIVYDRVFVSPRFLRNSKVLRNSTTGIVELTFIPKIEKCGFAVYLQMTVSVFAVQMYSTESVKPSFRNSTIIVLRIPVTI
jgi:hypothetical protein